MSNNVDQCSTDTQTEEIEMAEICTNTDTPSKQEDNLMRGQISVLNNIHEDEEVTTEEKISTKGETPIEEETLIYKKEIHSKINGEENEKDNNVEEAEISAQNFFY